MTWEEEKRFLEDRHHFLTEIDCEIFMYDTMARIMTNIDEGDYYRMSVITKNGTGWNFRVKKNS